MIAQSQDKGNNVANLIGDAFDHVEEEIPSVGTGRDVVVVGDITPDKDDVWVVSDCNFREVMRSEGIARVTPINHHHWDLGVCRKSLIDSVHIELVIVFSFH